MKNTLAALALLFCGSLLAQDQLYKKDNTRLNVKILEVGPEEIKYKLFDNQNGPTYIESKQNVNVIIYQNGQHEVLNSNPALPGKEPVPGPNNTLVVPTLERFDSAVYYRYDHNISLNFLNFFNNEVGLIYTREFFRSHFNIVIPIAVGVEKPTITQDIYFSRGSNNEFTVRRKMFEGGFGIHYYPSFKSNVNYYIGPVFRYQRYDGTQTYYSFSSGWPFGSGVITQKNTTLSRYCMSITNGIVIRTRSRLTTTLFASIGFKNDVIDDPITDPSGNQISSIESPLSLYIWTGFNVGFNF
jgi:hypothetical protein